VLENGGLETKTRNCCTRKALSGLHPMECERFYKNKGRVIKRRPVRRRERQMCTRSFLFNQERRFISVERHPP
jgi:hypothetical protein